MGGTGAGDLIASAVQWTEKTLDVNGPSSIDCKYFCGSNKKLRWAMGGGGAQRPVWRGNEPKKTGARSARARTRGQDPLVIYVYFGKGGRGGGGQREGRGGNSSQEGSKIPT
jgi:hypothetical protein